ncbi:Beta/Gamma crystallin [Nitrosospira multiformis]|uniref:Beta/Gamma crystallin n=1 Tax=Nitrosospira multiformis TaxID=1231 RepID=A0A1H8GBI7_9PROT|nr:beta/gamma crystallin domain-containing protein [Nitrosospira multiformis]SEN41130.1 Beta/Gamma crystallin [Nitrosospira multiformis]
MNILVKKNSRSLLTIVTLVFGLSVSAELSAQEHSDKQIVNKKSEQVESKHPGAKDSKMTIEVPVLTFVPVQVSTELENRGCWVKFFDKKNFQGDSLFLSGPVNLPRLIGPFGYDWENKVRSVKVGPRANLTIYDNREYRDQDKFLDAGANVANLSKEMGFFDNFRSMMLNCI